MENDKNYNTPYTIGLRPLKDRASIETYMNEVRKSPPAVLGIMTDEKTADFLEDALGPAFGLTEPAIEEITRILKDTLLGNSFVGDLSNDIKHKLNIEEYLAQQIKDKIVKELLAPAAEDIKKIHREKFPDRIKKGSEPVPPSPPQQTQPTQVSDSNVINLRNQQ
ncbi:MAG: hypothetical protein KBC81_02045 [Candidatus Pacebacteria bacterium]|nr:hypothetical protein [Candidatus Paceibacterota bacterium]